MLAVDAGPSEKKAGSAAGEKTPASEAAEGSLIPSVVAEAPAQGAAADRAPSVSVDSGASATYDPFALWSKKAFKGSPSNELTTDSASDGSLALRTPDDSAEAAAPRLDATADRKAAPSVDATAPNDAGIERRDVADPLEGNEPQAGRRSQETDWANEPSEMSIGTSSRRGSFDAGADAGSLGQSDEPQQLPPEVVDAYDSDLAEREIEINAAPEDEAAEPVVEEVVVGAAARRLKPVLESVLVYHHRRPEDAASRSPWGMLHALLPYGVDAQVTSGRRQYNMISWLCGNNVCRNQRLLSTQNGMLHPLEGIGLQGHQAQFLAILAQCRVPADYPVYADRRKYTVQDLVRVEQLNCKAGAELTFTLIGLSHYLSTDSQWKNASGETWNFERLLQEEIDQPVVGAACGGTHRLMGLAYALRKRRSEGLPITGQWRRAEIYVDDFTQYAWSLQNPDGSFSTDWFEGRADSRDLDRKVQTTGHILEWLMFVTPRAELQHPRMLKSVEFLGGTLARYRTREWEVGPKGHALRALSQFHRRLYAEAPPWRAPNRDSAQVATRR